MPITTNLRRYPAKDQMQAATISPKNSIASTSANPIASANSDTPNVRKTQRCSSVSHDFCTLIENNEVIIMPRVKKHLCALLREACPGTKFPDELTQKLKTLCDEQS